jgi:hypothetical protein
MAPQDIPWVICVSMRNYFSTNYLWTTHRLTRLVGELERFQVSVLA